MAKSMPHQSRSLSPEAHSPELRGHPYCAWFHTSPHPLLGLQGVCVQSGVLVLQREQRLGHTGSEAGACRKEGLLRTDAVGSSVRALSAWGNEEAKGRSAGGGSARTDFPREVLRAGQCDHSL